MKKILLSTLMLICSLLIKSQILSNEYQCHFKFTGDPGSFIYKETGDKLFTLTLNTEGEIEIALDIEIRDAKTRETNYMLLTGKADGKIDTKTQAFTASGNAIILIYEKEKLDTQWNISLEINGRFFAEKGLPKVSGTIIANNKGEKMEATLSGEGKCIDVPYEMESKFGYDYDIRTKEVFPLLLSIDYKDDNYVVKTVEFLKTYSQNYVFDYGYQLQLQNTHSLTSVDSYKLTAVFGPTYKVNRFDNSGRFEIEFQDLNYKALKDIPPDGVFSIVAQVGLFSKKDNTLQNTVDTFNVVIKNHYKLKVGKDGKNGLKLKVNGQEISQGSGFYYFPFGSRFVVPLEEMFFIYFIDGTIGEVCSSKLSSYDQPFVDISLGLSVAEGIDGESGNVLCFTVKPEEALKEKLVEKGVDEAKNSGLKLVLKTAGKVSVAGQLFEFLSSSNTGGNKEIAMVRLRSEVGIVIDLNGRFILKNFEGNPEVIVGGISKIVPVGQEFDITTKGLRKIVDDPDFDNLRAAANEISDTGSNSGLLAKIKGNFLFITLALGLLMALVFILRMGLKRKNKTDNSTKHHSSTGKEQIIPPTQPLHTQKQNFPETPPRVTPASGPKFCPQCGSSFKPGARFCGKCGYKSL